MENSRLELSERLSKLLDKNRNHLTGAESKLIAEIIEELKIIEKPPNDLDVCITSTLRIINMVLRLFEVL